MPWKTEPKLLRDRIRRGEWNSSTSGLCPGYVQANLAILPQEFAFDFLLFCQLNPKPCPILEVSLAGDPVLKEIAPGADLRTDLPAYRIFENGQLLEECQDIAGHWRDDLVGFLLGCSYTFDALLIQAGFNLPHVTKGHEPGIYTTNIENKPAGMFKGPLVVSARAIPGRRVTEAVLISNRFPQAHGAPVHVGDPSAIGINDLSQSEFGGQGIELPPGEVSVFWACGVTPQAVALKAQVPFMITHKPGHMFVSDMPLEKIVSP
ncbi:MAG: putative hydro-lyase [Desulfarculaceae bacterium]